MYAVGVDVTCKLVFQGFLEIDIGGRIIGIKEMGRLNEKAFKVAETSELYSSWQRQLGDLSWYPFKTAIVDGIHQVSQF